MGNRIYGCDDCLAVCPWNKFAKDAQEAKLAVRERRRTIRRLPRFSGSTMRRFAPRFRGTPIKRTGRDRFVRNALIAAGNANDASLVRHVEALIDDASPLVRAMAAWAIHASTRTCPWCCGQRGSEAKRTRRCAPNGRRVLA